MIQIKRNNKVFFTLEDFGEGSKLSYQLMDHHYIILKFTTATPVYFEIGDSVEIPDFGYFELTSAYFPKHNDSDGYDYEMQMDAYYMSWKNKLCKYRPQHGANETSFKLTTTVSVHMNVILGNLKALGLTYNGKEFSVDYTTYNNKAFDVQKRFLIEYGSISILDALNSICSEDALNCEWWIDGSIIYLGYCEMEGQTTFEQDVNVLSMSYSESKSTYITRLYAFGSDRNIPKGYFTGADADVTTDGVATDYLMLPNKEVDSDGFYAKDGYLENVNVVKNDKQAIEGVVMFEDEYPKVESVVSGIKTYDSTVDNDDGTKTTQTFWQVTATDSFATSFKESWIKSNLTLGIKFTSGALMGMEFYVSFKVIDKVNYFEIVANDTYGRTLPDGVMCPKVGDKFFLYNWDATKIADTNLIPTAQLSLFDRAKQYYQKTMISNSNFTCTMDGDKFYNDGTYDYHPLGEQVKLINDMFAQVDADGKHYRNSRIIGMEIPLDIPYDHPQYTVGEKAATSRLGKLEDKVDSITVNGMQIGSTGSGNGGVYVIGLNDSTPASDSNVYSARRSRMEFLSRLQDSTAKGTITWEKVQKFICGLIVGNNNEFSIDGSGNAILSSVLVNLLKSLDFNESEQSGFAIKQRSDGKYQMLLTDLIVWGKAIFNTLLIRELSYVGGNIVLSPAAGKISYIKEVYSETTNEMIAWRCYLLADDGTTATINSFKVDDQVRCQTFNIKPGVYENVSNKDYWRLITKVSAENEVITDSEGHELYDGKKFAWIQIAKENCMEGSDNPATGDTIVLMGNRSDTSRQHLLMMETEGDSAPKFTMYRGINSYSLKDKAIFDVGFDGVSIVSKFFKLVNVSGEKIWTPIYLGDWKEGTEYEYYDQVSWHGTMWLCIAPEGQSTTEEPTAESAYWKAMTEIIPVEIYFEHDFQQGFAYGREGEIRCKVYRGIEDLTSYVKKWKIERKSDDSVSDAAWLLRDKVKNFDGTISLICSQDVSVDDFGKGRKIIFTITAIGDDKEQLAQENLTFT
nr:MAG TPA: tail protein [Bacteriophage sp.]